MADDDSNLEKLKNKETKEEYLTRILEEDRAHLMNFIGQMVFYKVEYIEDIYQSVCLVLVEKYDKIDKEKPIFPYMCSIVRFTLMNMLRKQKNDNQLFVNQNPSEEMNLDLIDKAYCIDEYTVFYDELLKICKDELNRDERQLFEEWYLKQLSHAEIAQQHGFTIITSKKRKSRVDEKLRKKLKKVFSFI